MTIESVTTDWLETITGQQFTPFAHDPHFTLKSLVWGCARETRFSGQYSEHLDFYSVAEHQVLLTDWVRERFPGNYDLKDLRTIAMHDAPEGLIKDIVRPIKRISPDYHRLEDWFWPYVARRYDLHLILPDWIKELDNRILVDERQQAMNPSGNHWASIDDLEPLGVYIKGWVPREAAYRYERLLRDLGVA